MNRITAWVFDAAGTVFRDEHYAHIIWDQFFWEMGVNQHIDREVGWKKWTGGGNRALHDDLIQQLAERQIPYNPIYADYEYISSEFQRRYEDLINSDKAFIFRPGIQEAIRVAKSQNVPLAMISYDPRPLLMLKFAKMGWADENGQLTEDCPFESVITASEFGSKTDMLIETHKRIQKKNPNVLVDIIAIDDSITGRMHMYQAKPYIENQGGQLRAVIAYPNDVGPTEPLYSNFTITDHTALVSLVRILRLNGSLPFPPFIVEEKNHGVQAPYISKQPINPYSQRIEGYVHRHNGGASGEQTDIEKNPYGDSTLLIQKPYFIDYAKNVSDSRMRHAMLNFLTMIYGGYFHIGTLNVQTNFNFMPSPRAYEPANEHGMCFQEMHWSDLHSPETFIWSKMEISIFGENFPAFWYYPDPYTKKNTNPGQNDPHPHDFRRVEVITRLNKRLKDMLSNDDWEPVPVELGLVPGRFTTMPYPDPYLAVRAPSTFVQPKLK